MPKTSSTVLRRALLGAFLLSVWPAAAGAVQHEVRIYLDLDDDTATGCEVTTVAGVFEGAEQVLISTVETSSPPDAGTVTDVALAECTDEVADTFGIPTSFDGNWPVGVGNGVGGRDVVETYAPLLSLVIQDPSVVHLGLVVTDETGGEQALLTVDGTPEGDPIVLDLRSILEIPTLGEWGLILLALLLAAASIHLMGRRGTAAVGLALLMLATGVAWAAASLDGLKDDWSAGDLLASNGLVLSGKQVGDDLCFLVEVDLLFNQPPTITDIGDQTIPEDGTTGALPFTVDDPESPATSLTVTGTSSNQVLVPDSNLTLGGSGANRTIEITPEPNQNGMTDVTVTVEDPDGGTASTTFKVTVTSDNDPPTITAIADQTILEDGTTGALAFTVDDVETAPGSLTVTASSDDQTIIPDGNLVLGGSGANRTITVTPAANQFGGPVTITVLVQDGDGGSVPEQFDVTVTPVNDAPSFAAGPDQTVAEDSGAQNVSPWATGVSPGPANESGQTLTFNVTANTNPGLFSAGPTINASGDLSYTPAANANGSADVTIELMDDGGTANGGSDTSAPQTFTINVTAVNDPPVADDETVTAACNVEHVVESAPAETAAATGNVFRTVADNVLVGDSDPVEGTAVSIVEASGLPGGTTDTTAPFQITTNEGGSLTLHADGSFTYTPEAADRSVADTFTYTLQDADGGQDVATVTLNVGSVCVWFVDNSVSGTDDDGTGTSSDPFTSLVDEIGPDALADDAEDASVAGDVIYVFEGDSTSGDVYQGDFVADANQKLLGQGVDLVVDFGSGPETLFTGNTANRPLIDDADGDAVQVTDVTGVEVAGFQLDAADNVLQVTSASAATSVHFHDNEILGSGAEAIDLNPGSAGAFTATIEDNVFATSSAVGNAIDVTTAVGNSAAVEVGIEGNTDITSSGGTAIHLDGSLGTGTLFVTGFADNTVHGNTGGAGVIATAVTFDSDTSDTDFDQVTAGTWSIGSSGNPVATSGMNLGTGAEVEGNLSFTQLDVFAGNGKGLEVTGSGLFGGGSPGSGFRLAAAAGTVQAAGGPAVEIDPTTVALTLTSVTSTGSPTTGVSLVNVAGSFTAGSGSSITGSTGNAFHLTSTQASPLDVTYSGTITNTSGRLLNVDGLPTGSDLLFNGTSLTDTGGTGVAVNNFDGVMTVTATSTTITNSTSTGFAATGDTDGTVNLDDVTITNPAGTAVHIVDGADQIGGAFDFDNVDVSQANSARLLDVQGLNGGSVNFDSASALSATAGTGINVSSNAGTSPIVLGGPVDLGTSVNRISAGTAFSFTGNSAGTSVTAPDVDVFTSGQTAVNASDNGLLDLDALSINTASNGRALDLDGIQSLVDVDSVTCSHNSNCVDLTSLAASSTTTFAGAGLTCTGGTCFNASSARTVEVTGTGNAISATNAVGIDLDTTTIGANDVTWESISASGAANGIVLNTTGTTGDFTVTGDGGGSQNASGGTIQNTTADGISLTDAEDITLSQIAVDNTGRHGLFGTGVKNLAINDSTFEDTGNANAEDAFSFRTNTGGTDANITGSLLLDNVDVTRFFDAGLIIYNETGSLTFSVTNGSDFTDGGDIPGSGASFGHAVYVETEGDASVTGAVNGSTFDDIEGDAVRFEAGSTGTNDIDVIGGVITDPGGPDNFPNGGSVQVIVTNASTLTFDIQGNSFTDLPGDGIGVVGTAGSGSVEGRIGGPNPSDGNTINGSPTLMATDGINVSNVGIDAAGQETWTLLIQNNTITTPGAVGDDGIQFAVGDDNGIYNITIEDNSISNTASEGIRFFLDDDSNQTPSLALRVADNAFSGIGDGAIELATRESSTACAHIVDNDNGSGGSPGTIALDERDSSVIEITQASTAALATANNGATVSVDTNAVSFNGGCTNPTLPAN